MDIDPVTSTINNDTSETSAIPPYSEAFENAVAHSILNPSADRGVEPSDDTTNSSGPNIGTEELPLALNHPSRIYRSHIPGVLLTHPSGSHLGGVGLFPDSPELQGALHEFVTRNNVTSPAQLQSLVNKEVAAKLAEIRSAAQARNEALEKNARMDREIEQLTAQREIEVKVMRRKKEEAERRRGEREEKRKARERKLRAKEERGEDAMDLDKGDEANKRQKISHP